MNEDDEFVRNEEGFSKRELEYFENQNSKNLEESFCDWTECQTPQMARLLVLTARGLKNQPKSIRDKWIDKWIETFKDFPEVSGGLKNIKENDFFFEQDLVYLRIFNKDQNENF